MNSNEEWLKELLVRLGGPRDPEAWDESTDTLFAVGGVIVTTAVINSREAESVAAYTRLRVEFVSHVLAVADKIKLWEAAHYATLVCLVDEASLSEAELKRSAIGLIDVFFLHPSVTDSVERLLGNLRRGIPLGGMDRPWPQHFVDSTGTTIR